MPSLALFKSGNQSFDLFQTRLKSELDPILANLLVQGSLLPNISLLAGDNVINHKLARNQIGWVITDMSAGVTIYRSQPLNNRTLVLNASAPVTISLWVF